MRFQCSGPMPINVEIDRDGWTFWTALDQDNFDRLRVSERLSLRRQFEAQVGLAKNTPTKGDTQ
jgi:hypothetical protein